MFSLLTHIYVTRSQCVNRPSNVHLSRQTRREIQIEHKLIYIQRSKHSYQYYHALFDFQLWNSFISDPVAALNLTIKCYKLMHTCHIYFRDLLPLTRQQCVWEHKDLSTSMHHWQWINSNARHETNVIKPTLLQPRYPLTLNGRSILDVHRI